MRRSGFTLIELLIVVAIIAILAAIAVPNFLEAQTRAKVSRAKADIRSLATALEAYRIDGNAYPNDFQSPGYYWYITGAVSTPIAYITSSFLQDPFRGNTTPFHLPPEIYGRLRYVNFIAGRDAWPSQGGGGVSAVRTTFLMNAAQWTDAINLHGQWKLSSSGPDREAEDPGAAGDPFLLNLLIYDPTNGTLSKGDIVRTQRFTEEH
jgi:prepilin-type N-terminal cleavage/methylation domain-containing protein